MPIHNTDAREIFDNLADLLEIEGSNPFRVRAIRNASRIIGGLPESISDMVGLGADLTKIEGIGKDLAAKIEEIVRTGRLGALEELKEKNPPGILQLLKIPGLGPKKVRALRDALGIASVGDLREALKGKKLRNLEGFGEKTEENIARELEHLGEREGRFLLGNVEDMAVSLLSHLKKVEGVEKAIVAGSYRRRRETVGDLDILVTCSSGAKVMESFTGYDEVESIVTSGSTKSTVILKSRLQVDLRVVADESYGAALHYFTGSKDHNIAVRTLALDRGLKINEYGVFREKSYIAGRTEEEVYTQVGLPFIEPELREAQGEIEAAQKGMLPKLVTLEDIRGDLHMHTSETDGHDTLEMMARAARDMGYEYIAITDHTKRTSVARGMDRKRLAAHIAAMELVQEKFDDITILKGAEVDILEDGSLDLPDDILKELDLTVCAVHYNQKLPRDKQTERILRAMDNPWFTILAHPSGRLLNEREPYEVDMMKVLEAARDRGRILELNGHPMRLDLTDQYCRIAGEMGVRIAISTDSHSASELRLMRYGIGQARRGWLECKDVINTMSLKDLKAYLKR